MRTKRGEKDILREEILLKAAPFLKVAGSSGASVDKIMQAAGVTSGALYSHFTSKHHFYEQVILRELDRMLALHTSNIQIHGQGALLHFLKTYLSDAHIDAVDRGCVFAALGADMHRLSEDARVRVAGKTDQLMTMLAKSIRGDAKEEHIATVRYVFSTMIGALTLARSVGRNCGTKYLKTAEKHLQAFLKSSGGAQSEHP